MKNKTLILWLDGLSWKFINKKTTPFLHELGERFGHGVQEPVFGYSSMPASFFTGKSPNEHRQLFLFKKSKKADPILKIPNNHIINLLRYLRGEDYFAPPIKIRGEGSFELAQKKFYHHKGSLPVPTLFDHLREMGISFCFYNWPLWAASNKPALTPFVRGNDRSRTLHFLRNLKKEKYQTAILHLWDFDAAAHKHGVPSTEAKKALEIYDWATKKVLKIFNLKKDTILIWSDHGMVRVEKTVNPAKILSFFERKPTYFADSAALRLWFENPPAEQTFEKINSLGFGHFLIPEEQKALQIDRLKPDFFKEIFVLKPGYIFFPSFFETRTPSKATHGYLPEHIKQESRPLYITNKATEQEIKTQNLLKLISDSPKVIKSREQP